MQRDYETLKIKPGATLEEVKRAYKKQAMEWHPDRFPGDDEVLQKKATKQFHRITEAYTRLETRHNKQSEGHYADEQPDYTSYGGDPMGDEGRWQDEIRPDLPQFITRTWKNGDKYEGMGINKMMHGMGIFTFANGSVFTGQFRSGTMNGQGKYSFANGDVYSGGFMDNQFHGQGKMTFANGSKYMGNFSQDQFHGEGVFVTPEGKVLAGQWEYGNLMTEPESPFGRY
jgi:curved DNA-binding protein CbpA